MCKELGYVSALAATADRLVAGYRHGVVLLKQVGAPVVHLRTACDAVTHAVAVRGAVVAAVRHREVDVWIGTSKVATLRCAGLTSALHLAPDYRLWVGAGVCGALELWDDPQRTVRRLGTLHGHLGAITGIAVDAEGGVVSAALTRRAGARTLWRSQPPARAW